MADTCVTVAPVRMADAGLERSGDPQNRAPTMAPTVAAALYARPYLSLVPRDAIIAAVEQLDAKLREPATMAEYPPVIPGGKRLFRYVQADGEELTACSVPEALLTPHVRALWWEFAEAVEAEARRR